MNDCTTTKRCSKCGAEKPLTEFRREKKSKDGLKGQCKTCCYEVEHAWRERNPERVRENNRRYREQHPEEIAQYKREWAIKNEDHLREKRRDYRATHIHEARASKSKWYAENAEYAREYTRRWRTENPERAKESQRNAYLKRRDKIRQRVKLYRQQWEKNNPDKVRVKNHKRRARKLENGGAFTADDVLIQYRSQRGKCWHCGKSVGDDYHVDHLIPLARGGTNDARNIVISCPKCNMSRGAKLPQEWNGRLF